MNSWVSQGASVFLSPLSMILVVEISYFLLCFNSDFRYQNTQQHLIILGIFTFVTFALITPIRLLDVTISYRHANKLLTLFCGGYMLLVVYLYAYLKLDFKPLLDSRFAIPGFGIVFSYYATTTIVGCALICRFGLSKTAIIFAMLNGLLGLTIGGKGAAINVLLGVGLAARLGLLGNVPRYKILSLCVLVAIITMALFLQQSGADVLYQKLLHRIYYSADSVTYVAQISGHSIETFETTPATLFADLFLRFVGFRFSEVSVGAELAAAVSGESGGGGPNPTLPVLAYVISKGKIFDAVLFISGLAFSLYWLVRIFKKGMLGRNLGFYYASAIFFLPLVVLDLVGYFQIIFWLAAHGGLLALTLRSRGAVNYGNTTREIVSS